MSLFADKPVVNLNYVLHFLTSDHASQHLIFGFPANLLICFIVCAFYSFYPFIFPYLILYRMVEWNT